MGDCLYTAQGELVCRERFVDAPVALPSRVDPIRTPPDASIPNTNDMKICDPTLATNVKMCADMGGKCQSTLASLPDGTRIVVNACVN